MLERLAEISERGEIPPIPSLISRLSIAPAFPCRVEFTSSTMPPPSPSPPSEGDLNLNGRDGSGRVRRNDTEKERERERNSSFARRVGEGVRGRNEKRKIGGEKYREEAARRTEDRKSMRREK